MRRVHYWGTLCNLNPTRITWLSPRTSGTRGIYVTLLSGHEAPSA